MNKFQMTCNCGDVMSCEAENRDAAVSKMKGIMVAEAIAAHMAEKHAGDPVPAVSEVHAMIDQGMQAAQV